MASTPPQRTNVKLSSTDQEVLILYTNYRGEKGWRHIRPIRIWFGATEWHPGKQWLMDAHDVEKNAERSFALQDIHSWEVPEA